MTIFTWGWEVAGKGKGKKIPYTIQRNKTSILKMLFDFLYEYYTYFFCYCVSMAGNTAFVLT